MEKLMDYLRDVAIIRRLAVIIVAGALIFAIAIPNITYHLKQDKKPSFTFSELIQMNKEDIPLYFKISDAVVPDGGWVESRKGKKLKSITYPVYPNDSTLANEIKVVVKDSRVKESELETYFFSPEFSIEGEYRSSGVDGETLDLIKSFGRPVSGELIVINRGSDPMPMIGAIGMVIACVLIGGLFIMSFIPKKE